MSGHQDQWVITRCVPIACREAARAFFRYPEKGLPRLWKAMAYVILFAKANIDRIPALNVRLNEHENGC
jgi:hypothetical protein